MMARVLPGSGETRRILITHADADHSGGAGYRSEPILLSRGTCEVIREANRAYGSRIAASILEEVYTHLINLFSGFNPPKNPVFLPPEGIEWMGSFPVLTRLDVGSVQFTVLAGLGGHLHGQVYLVAPDAGILFTGDSLINFASISSERTEFNGYADFLMTTVNVDSTSARAERAGLIALAQDIDRQLAADGRRCLICGGHGAVSVLEGERLRAIGEIQHYTPDDSDTYHHSRSRKGT
jgi:glyoxylase-like metal-dependent hydrolase (beta-lactamase superfamily II)